MQMGARFGMKTVISDSQLTSLEKSGFSIEASASLAFNKLDNECPGDACKQEADKKRKAGLIEGEGGKKRAGIVDGLERELEREEDDGSTYRKMMLPVVHHTSFSGGTELRPDRAISQFDGWEKHWVKVDPSTNKPTKMAVEDWVGEALEHHKAVVIRRTSAGQPDFERVSVAGSVQGATSNKESSASSFEEASTEQSLISIGMSPKEGAPAYPRILLACMLARAHALGPSLQDPHLLLE